MKLLVTTLNVLIALYFFILANFFFWGSILAMFMGVFTNQELLKTPWLLFTNILFAPFFIYGIVMFFRKTKTKYKYGLVLLLVFWLQTQVIRFLFITGNRLENADLSNLLLAAIPAGIIYLSQALDRKS